MASTDVVHFNADTEPDEGAREPFVFVFEGRTYTATDPADLDYQELLTVGDNPMGFFKITMNQEDRDALAEAKGLKGRVLGKIVQAYLEHFKADDPKSMREKLGF